MPVDATSGLEMTPITFEEQFTVIITHVSLLLLLRFHLLLKKSAKTRQPCQFYVSGFKINVS